MIDAVIERCVGIDVGKKFLVACVMTGPAHGEARSEIRQGPSSVSSRSCGSGSSKRVVPTPLWRARVRTASPSSMYWKTW